jgi:23S rRNA (cytosine1962-C5)-methyltransferase
MPGGTPPTSRTVLAPSGLGARDDAGMATPEGYQLMDAGSGRRLERFGERIVDRPAPGALAPRRGTKRLWDAADLRFERDRGWLGLDRSHWSVAIDGLTLEARPTAAGQLGIYPEHARFWPWLRDALADRLDATVLHLFAATGATTLALAAAGAQVTHVDASRPAVAWARRNAELSGLADRPIRWIVDDALAYTRREARRRRRYDGVVLDPPSYGHGPGGARWELASALPGLLEAVRDVAGDDAFILVTAHTTGLEPDDLRETLAAALGAGGIAAEHIDVVATSGARLPLGVAARMIRG